MPSTKKVAIVTGAGSGIGQAVALEYLSAGYHVALAGRRESALDETISLATDANDRVVAIPTDVSDPSAVRALFTKVKNQFD